MNCDRKQIPLHNHSKTLNSENVTLLQYFIVHVVNCSSKILSWIYILIDFIDEGKEREISVTRESHDWLATYYMLHIGD